ncbi:hypothetical protein MJT46_005174 [Ovis ammon polii x Ovis aries]|nr:hypothetical protein MJT46_005174 [Ovis ammon polii x Ovis aries]
MITKGRGDTRPCLWTSGALSKSGLPLLVKFKFKFKVKVKFKVKFKFKFKVKVKVKVKFKFKFKFKVKIKVKFKFKVKVKVKVKFKFKFKFKVKVKVKVKFKFKFKFKVKVKVKVKVKFKVKVKVKFKVKFKFKFKVKFKFKFKVKFKVKVKFKFKVKVKFKGKYKVPGPGLSPAGSSEAFRDNGRSLQRLHLDPTLSSPPYATCASPTPPWAPGVLSLQQSQSTSPEGFELPGAQGSGQRPEGPASGPAANAIRGFSHVEPEANIRGNPQARMPRRYTPKGTVYPLCGEGGSCFPSTAWWHVE